MDQMRRAIERHTAREQRFVRSVDVGYTEVEDRRTRCLFEQQTRPAEVEEREAGRVEARHEPEPEDVAVERDRAVEVGGSLRDLVERLDRGVGHRATIRLRRTRAPG